MVIRNTVHTCEGKQVLFENNFKFSKLFQIYGVWQEKPFFQAGLNLHLLFDPESRETLLEDKTNINRKIVGHFIW